MDEKLAIIKAKKVGLFMRLAREKAAVSSETAAKWLSIDENEYTAFENGELSPSLPQLESLAYLFHTRFDFLTHGPSETEAAAPDFSQEVNAHLLDLRNHVIAALLKQNREQKGISIDQLEDLTSIPEDALFDYENGKSAVPMLDLEEIINNLGISMDAFFSANGPFRHEDVSQATPAPQVMPQPAVAPQTAAPAAPALPGNLPADLLEFINKPVNRPYLELAMRLSQMEADKLRSIAASLLEITY
jgi:Uncharacterized protein conserved in bacteria